MTGGLFDSFGKKRPPDLLVGGLRAAFQHQKAVLEGTDPPHVVQDIEESEALVELAGHIRKLPGAAGAIGMELIRRRVSEIQARLTRRRQRQRIRHDGARRRGQPSPIEVWCFILKHERCTGEARGASAAAARHFNKDPARISNLVKLAKGGRKALLMALDILQVTEESLAGATDLFGCVEALDLARRQNKRLRADIERLMRRLPPRQALVWMLSVLLSKTSSISRAGRFSRSM
jgi:hypothetical protein